jgi:uncharacterized protein (TIGR02284 family)
MTIVNSRRQTMSLETKYDLDQETIDRLQTLIRYNIDAYDGFRKSAEEIKNPHLASLFRDLAQERSAMATELQEYVEWNNEKAEDDGSLRAAVHRTWIDVRNKLSGGSNYAVLAEAERGEDYIKEAYEDFLKSHPGSALNDVVQQQYARVKSAHDRIRDLRDHYKEDES